MPKSSKSKSKSRSATEAAQPYEAPKTRTATINEGANDIINKETNNTARQDQDNPVNDNDKVFATNTYNHIIVFSYYLPASRKLHPPSSPDQYQKSRYIASPNRIIEIHIRKVPRSTSSSIRVVKLSYAQIRRV